jgi:hypothetical protein
MDDDNAQGVAPEHHSASPRSSRGIQRRVYLPEA